MFHAYAILPMHLHLLGPLDFTSCCADVLSNNCLLEVWLIYIQLKEVPTHVFPDKESNFSASTGIKSAPESLQDAEEAADVKEVSQKTVSFTNARKREWCNLPEWQQLKQMSKLGQTDLCKMPEVPKSGIFRNPSSKFWSCTYPTKGCKTASWKSGRSEFQCIVKVLRQLIKFHIEECPPHTHAWQNQLNLLADLEWSWGSLKDRWIIMADSGKKKTRQLRAHFFWAFLCTLHIMYIYIWFVLLSTYLTWLYF